MNILDILENIILKGKIYIPRWVINSAAYYVVPGVLLVLYIFTSSTNDLNGDLGEIAKNLLLFVLLVKPASVIFRRIGLLRTIVGYRRQLGITTFYFALFHFLFYTAEVGLAPPTVFTAVLTDVGANMWYGALGLLGMVVLYVTSNKIAQKNLGKWWKRIQRISYLVLPLILIHAELMEGHGYASATGLITLFALTKGVEWFILGQRKKARLQKLAPDV